MDHVAPGGSSRAVTRVCEGRSLPDQNEMPMVEGPQARVVADSASSRTHKQSGDWRSGGEA
eukprot:7088000-Alexandrium_andersonii.AAC.1